MKLGIKFKLHDGEHLHRCFELIAIDVWKLFRNMDGEKDFGKENIVPLEKIRNIVRTVIEKNEWVSIKDKKNPLYELWIEQKSSYIMGNFIMHPGKNNPFFYKTVLNLPGEGYILANDHETVEEINRIKKGVIKGMRITLEHRIHDANERIEERLLPNRKKPEQLPGVDVQ